MPEPAPIETALVQTERWFVARGLPHFVERHDTVWTIWSRAVPLLVVAYVLLGLNALDLHSWSWQRNVLAAAFVLAVLVVIWMGSNRMRGLPLLQRPREVGPVELALLVLVPATCQTSALMNRNVWNNSSSGSARAITLRNTVICDLVRFAAQPSRPATP